MLEAAWLFAAIELNGLLIAKGAQATIHQGQCMVERKVMAPLLAPHHARQFMRPPHEPKPIDVWVTDAAHCSFDDAEGVMRIRLPQNMLAEKKLALAEPSGAMGIALLHDASLLAGHADYSGQPMPQVIPSAALDAFVGSDLNGLGITTASGPWSASLLHQAPSQGHAATRAGSEYLLANGAQLRVGDFRAERGPEQLFGEYRGLHLTSHAPSLKSDGKAEALLSVQSPSKVQFLDRHGIAIYSSELLAPGSYRVQGYAASAVPGFLQAQLVDVNGSVQLVTLPWTADRRLALEGETQWDLLAGYPRQLQSGLRSDLSSPPVIAAKARYGLSAQLTAAGSLERAGQNHRASLEATSSAWDGTLATVALGQTCADQGCDANWLTELRTSLGNRWHASLGMQQSADITGASVPTRSAQLHLTGQLHADLTGSLHLARSMDVQVSSPAPTSRQVATLAASMRITPSASIQFQARHHLLASDASAWSGYIGMTLHFAQERTTVSGQVSFPSQGKGSLPRLGMQAAYGGGPLFGPHLSVAHTQDAQARSDAYARYASPYGDVSMRADTASDRASWSASSRVWLTSQGARLAPAGEDNLVIQKIGVPAVRVSQAGRDAQVSDRDGIAVFRKAPSWTDAVYAIDAASIPFGAQLSASRIRVPLASNRAYVVDYRHLWSQSRSWRIVGFDAIRAARITESLDRSGKRVFLGDDGYADLQSMDQLPLAIATEHQGRLVCELYKEQAQASMLQQEVLLQCAPQIAL